MINIKSAKEIEKIKTACKHTGTILNELGDFIKPGMTTKDVDEYIDKRIADAGMTPTFKGYGGFPAVACISVNEVVIHGIPGNRVINEGDIVSVDMGSTFQGYVSDAARTYAVGRVSKEAERLIEAAREGFFAALEYCRAGSKVSDISHAVQKKIEEYGYGIVRDYTGHGMGRVLHEDPQIPNYGKPGRGATLRSGMTIAIEPMITEGSELVKTLDDGWTVVTIDGKNAAHYENSVLITDDEPVVMTLV